MSQFYKDFLTRLTDLLDARDGVLEATNTAFVLNYFPGLSPTYIRALCEWALADGIISGYSHRPNGTKNRTLAIIDVNTPALKGFRPGFNTAADNTICYAALHPDHEGRATIAKFGQSSNPDNRRYALFPHSRRLLPMSEMYTLASPNAVQVEQVMRLMFSALTVGGANRQNREYLRAPTFLGSASRNSGQNARDLTFALLSQATDQVVAEIANLDTIDRYDPAQRRDIAKRVLARLAIEFDVKTTRPLPNGLRSFTR